jgi:transposase
LLISRTKRFKDSKLRNADRLRNRPDERLRHDVQKRSVERRRLHQLAALAVEEEAVRVRVPLHLQDMVGSVAKLDAFPVEVDRQLLVEAAALGGV